jgi:hypothetical protein
LLVALLCSTAAAGAPADGSAGNAQTSPGEGQASSSQTANSQPLADEKRGQWVLAPIPINSPAVGAGLEWAAARVFPLNKEDRISPPSVLGVGGAFTNNGTRAIAAGGRLYMKEDRYRIAGGIGGASVKLDVYGVDRAAGDRGSFVPLNTEGGGFIGEFLFGLKQDLFIGLRGQYRDLKLSLDRERMDSSDIRSQPPEQVANVVSELSEQLFRQQTVSIGPRFLWDSRNDVFYPKKGLVMEAGADFFAHGLGSKWDYQYYKIAFNKYNQLGEHQVLAFRGMGCAAAGDRVPIYDLCLFGAMNDLRGYPAGRFQDRRMFATQGEYRLMLPVHGFLGRFGVVAFGGFGGVAGKFSDIGFDDLLPAGGGGLRFRLVKKYPINFRVDYGFGKVGNTLSVGVLEAF